MAKKENLHRNFREIEVRPIGDAPFKFYSTYKKDVLLLEIDRKRHPAWNTESKTVVVDDSTKYSKRWKDIDFFSAVSSSKEQK